jgi:hypothetical protein
LVRRRRHRFFGLLERRFKPAGFAKPKAIKNRIPQGIRRRNPHFPQKGVRVSLAYPYAGITQIRLNGRRQIPRPLSLAFPKLPLDMRLSLRKYHIPRNGSISRNDRCGPLKLLNTVKRDLTVRILAKCGGRRIYPMDQEIGKDPSFCPGFRVSLMIGASDERMKVLAD